MIENPPDSIYGGICGWITALFGSCPGWLNIQWVTTAIKAALALAMVVSIGSLIFESLKGHSEENETIAGFEALRLLADARPNSLETTAILLADATRLGRIRSWGRPRPKMALATYIPAVEEIPPDVWGYAVLNAAFAKGPLPRSDMEYRQKYLKPYLEDERVLYDAVRFSKKEFLELCRSERSSVKAKTKNTHT